MYDPDHDDQRPGHQDYQLAAAAYLHYRRGDMDLLYAVLGDASDAGRTTALFRAVINVALYAPGVLGTSEGTGRLQAIAVTMAGDDPPDTPAPDEW